MSGLNATIQDIATTEPTNTPTPCIANTAAIICPLLAEFAYSEVITADNG
jgi:hypothetical protein